MAEFKKILVWTILNEKHHPLTTLEEKKLKAFSPIIETLFPGMTYSPRPGFAIVNRRFFAPVLKKMFPEIEGMDPEKISKDDTIVIDDTFLVCDGYQYDKDPEWQKKFDELLIKRNVKKVNKEATIQNVLNWANRSAGHSIDVKKFNEKMGNDDWEDFLIEVAKSCQVEIIYL